VGVLVSTTVSADVVSAFVARASSPSDYGCFREYWGSTINNCSSAKMLIVPLTVRTTGLNMTVKTTASGNPTSSQVGCRVLGVDRWKSVWSSSTYYLPASGTWDISATTWVPSDGMLFAACDVWPNGRVDYFTW
jgi:hypothetical protein